VKNLAGGCLNANFPLVLAHLLKFEQDYAARIPSHRTFPSRKEALERDVPEEQVNSARPSQLLNVGLRPKGEVLGCPLSFGLSGAKLTRFAHLEFFGL
jgi:hypothetical protein